MKMYTWFEGEKSFVAPGTAPRHGDPELTLSFDRPKDLPWNEQLWFCIDVKVEQFSEGNVTARFYADGRAEPLSIHYEILPNLDVSFRVSIDELWSRRHFLPVFPGSFKAHCRGVPMDPRDVERVEISVLPGKDFRGAVLRRVYVSDEEPAGVRPERPLVDPLGQMKDCEWPTKTHSFAEMEARLKAELAEAQKGEDDRRGMSAYGGYKAKRFEATGWFRTQHDGDRWWLVDPEGCAFFSHGVCYGTRMGEFGWYSGMEGFYEDMPSPDDPRFAGAFTHPGLIAEYVKRHGVTKRSNEWMVNPARVNMMRVFGDGWWEAWRQLATSRFRKWGINTTGVGIVNFVDERVEDFLRLSKLPYAVTLKRFPVTNHFIFRDFPDVFAPEYAANSAKFAQNELAPLKDDPYLLGYFLHNEPEWMFQADYCVAYELMVNEAPLESRRHLKGWLQARYADVDSLNREWGLKLAGWDAICEPVGRDWRPTQRAWEELAEYEQVLILAFGQIPLEACRKVDPHHLCLGLRHGGFTDKVVDGSAIFDVFSFNYYRHSPKEPLELARRANRPTLIGEWHFGGQEVGLMRTALQSCVDQENRAKAYRKFLEEAASCPWCVGAHYFEYNDQSLLGRFDGEHMAHGLIDCTNQPYPAMAKAISQTSDELYRVLTGEQEPYCAEIEYLSPHW